MSRHKPHLIYLLARCLAQSILTFDLGFFQTADARQRSPTVSHRHDNHNLIRPRRIAHARLDRIKMTAHECGIFMSKRHVDRRSERAHFFRRGHQRRAFFHRFAQRRAELRMQNRDGVFQLARFADDGRFAIAFRLIWRNAECIYAALSEHAAQGLLRAMLVARKERSGPGSPRLAPWPWAIPGTPHQRSPKPPMSGAQAQSFGNIPFSM